MNGIQMTAFQPSVRTAEEDSFSWEMWVHQHTGALAEMFVYVVISNGSAVTLCAD